MRCAGWVTGYNTGLSPGQINIARLKSIKSSYFQNKRGKGGEEGMAHWRMRQYVMYQNTIIKSILAIHGPASTCLTVVGPGEWYLILDVQIWFCSNI